MLTDCYKIILLPLVELGGAKFILCKINKHWQIFLLTKSPPTFVKQTDTCIDLRTFFQSTCTCTLLATLKALHQMKYFSMSKNKT